jgi:signal transduction histidine kinase
VSVPAGRPVRRRFWLPPGAEALVDTRAGDRIAGELAALRRVAVPVARGAPPQEIFTAVTAEVRRLLDADLTAMARYDPDATVTTVASWSASGEDPATDLRTARGERSVSSLVFQTGRPARMDDYSRASCRTADLVRELGVRSGVGVPVSVEGRLWGVMVVLSASEQPLPADTEARLASFAELAGTAIANAEAQAALAASRARIVAAADEARHRIQRDLHDGAQQHLVTLALQLREAQQMASPGSGELVKRLDDVAAGLEAALEELREIARGVHPALLAEAGLRPALRALARRCPVPVDLRVQAAGRPPGQAEIAAYYVVAEALTNTAKHARASAAKVEVAADDGVLRVCVRDDGRGGADFGHGSGLVGLKDRVEAAGGRIWLHSPPGGGTTLTVHIPLASSSTRG